MRTQIATAWKKKNNLILSSLNEQNTTENKTGASLDQPYTHLQSSPINTF